MNKNFYYPLFLAFLFLSCKSTTMINTTPSGAKVYINNEYKGNTPYEYSDKKLTGSITDLRIEKEGYDTFNYRLKRDEKVNSSAIIGGYLTLAPFLWIMEYNPTRTYELRPIENRSESNNTKQIESCEKNEYFNIAQEIGSLLKDEIINNEEYDILMYNIKKSNISRKKLTAEDIIQIKRINGLLKLGDIDSLEYKNTKVKILGLRNGFDVGDMVKCALNDGQHVQGKVIEFKNNGIIIEYDKKYLIGEGKEKVLISLKDIQY